MVPGDRRDQRELRLVRAEETLQPADPAPEDALEALLSAREGYRAAADAVDGVALPSLTDFVD